MIFLEEILSGNNLRAVTFVPGTWRTLFSFQMVSSVASGRKAACFHGGGVKAITSRLHAGEHSCKQMTSASLHSWLSCSYSTIMNCGRFAALENMSSVRAPMLKVTTTKPRVEAGAETP